MDYINNPYYQALGTMAGLAGHAAYKYTKPYGYKTAVLPYRRPRRIRGRYHKVPKTFKRNLLNLKDTKFVDDASVALSPVAGTSAILTVNLIAQNDTDAGRDGSDIYLTSFQYKFQANYPIAGTITDTLKLHLVLAHDTRGVQLAITQLFETDAINSMRAIDNSKNFRILKSMRIRLQPMTTTSDVNTILKSMYIKFKNPIRCKYDGTAADDASIDRNGLYLVAMSGNATANAVTITGETRLAFKDI